MTGRPAIPDRRWDILSTDAFWSRVSITEGCWEWGGPTGEGGYGFFVYEGSRRQAHRDAYTSLVGPIPEGLVLDHLCRNRVCVRPDHLEPVTLRINTLRGTSVPAINARKIECGKGHPFTEANTYLYRGKRSCRTCRHEASLRYVERRRGVTT